MALAWQLLLRLNAQAKTTEREINNEEKAAAFFCL
jgi:hypothetical protein